MLSEEGIWAARIIISLHRTDLKEGTVRAQHNSPGTLTAMPGVTALAASVAASRNRYR